MFKSDTTRKVLDVGVGYAAAVVARRDRDRARSLDAASTAAARCNSNLKAEAIAGTPYMAPAAIKGEATRPASKNVSFPTCTVAGTTVDNGTARRCFAQYMRIHALERRGSRRADGPLREAGTPASSSRRAAADNHDFARSTRVEAAGPNGSRNLGSGAALTSALNLAYTAQQISLFSIIVAFALLLSGIGFVILALGGALRRVTVAATETEKAQLQACSDHLSRRSTTEQQEGAALGPRLTSVGAPRAAGRASRAGRAGRARRSPPSRRFRASSARGSVSGTSRPSRISSSSTPPSRPP